MKTETKAYLKHVFALPAGFAWILPPLGLVWAFLMTPQQALRWAFAPGSSDEKIARALDPTVAFEDLQRKLAEANAVSAQCLKAQSAAAVVQTKLRPANPACVLGVEGLSDQYVPRDQAVAFLGGRLHINVTANPGSFIGGCPFYVGTDLEDSHLIAIRFGAAQEVKTSIGSYRVIPTTWTDKILSRGCVFDIVKVPSAEPSTPSGPPISTGSIRK